MQPSNVQLVFAAITPIVEAFEQLGVDYHIGGSVASSAHGIIRATFDADLVAVLRQEHVRPFVKLLEGNYYIDADAVRDAIRRKSSFNAIHLDTMLKVDIFIPKARLFDQEELHRVQLKALIKDTRPFYIASPEGTILNKLERYKMGGGVSDRQWNDILGVLKVPGSNLDMDYLQRWAKALDVADLFQRALLDAGLVGDNKGILFPPLYRCAILLLNQEERRSDHIQMNSTRPYKHILKNLFHEQASELIPLLMPGYQVEQVLNVEMPELESTYIEGTPGPLGEGLVQMVAPGAQVLGMYKTRWIEHSGKFERAYRVLSPMIEGSSYLVIEFQTEREDKMLPRRLLLTHLRTDSYVDNDTVQNDDDLEPDMNDIEQDDDEHKHEGTRKITYVYPVALGIFPQDVPAPIRDMIGERLISSFNFKVVGLWEIDSRETLNTHVTASYFLLPVMKNADAALLGLAIEELAQKFQHDETELGRHLSGLSLLLHLSETMPEEEKRAAQEHLKRFTHLVKDDPTDE